MGKKGNAAGKAFQAQTTRLYFALAVLAGGGLYLASHVGHGLSGVESHLLEQGPDGCYPLKAQLLSRAPVSGAYDLLLLSRAVVNGLCAVDPSRPVCATHALAADDVTTTIHGFYGIRVSCHAAESDGFHFPQYCASSSGHLNATAFGLLASQGPDRDACEHKHRWPAAFCDRLASLRAVWPSIEEYATDGLSSDAAKAAEGAVWAAQWERFGSCSGMHPEAYFDAAVAADRVMLEHDKLDEKTLGPAWPSPDSGTGPFEKPFTLKLLGARFGGAYAAGFHCEKAADGRTFLTEVKQCVRAGDAGEFRPTTCPRWVLDADKSCRPSEGVGKGGIGGAQVWLGLAPPKRH